MYEIKLNKKAQNLTLKHVERSIKLYQTGRRGTPGVVQSIVAGTNVTVDSTDPANPVVSSSGGPTYYEGHYASGNTVYYSQKYEFVYAFNPSMSSLSSLTLDLTSGINENILAGGGLWSEAGIDSFNFTLPDGYTAVNEPGSLSAGQSLHFAVDYTNDRVVFY